MKKDQKSIEKIMSEIFFIIAGIGMIINFTVGSLLPSTELQRGLSIINLLLIAIYFKID